MAEELDETERGVERLIFFTDAVAAIAITLLILPLVDIVSSDAGKVPLLKLLNDKDSQIEAFALSFLIIARFWLANHEILRDVMRTSTLLMWLDIGWVFTIVILPLPTEITSVYPASRLTVAIYIGTSFVSTLLLTAMSVYLYLHPELERRGKPTSAVQVWGISSTAAAFLIAFALNLIFPTLHYYSLFALLLTIPLDWFIKPGIRRREKARLSATAK